MINFSKIVPLILPLAAMAAEPVIPEKDFTIPRIEHGSSEFKLDGKLNDKVWEKAASIDGFSHVGKKSSGKAVINQTSVKVFYDVDALCLGFTCSDKNIGRIVMGLPADQTVDVPMGGSDDCIELMIFQPGSDRTYYHLRIVPSGAKDDALNIHSSGGGMLSRDSSWNGDWQVKTSKDEKAWYAEVRIPFRMFAETQGGTLCGTPAKGEKIRMNFGRISSTSSETSSWASGASGFHDKFISCAFSGWQFGDIALGSSGNIRFRNGGNSQTFSLENLSSRPAKVHLKAVLSEDEPDAEARRIQLQKRSWIVPKRNTQLMDAEYELKPGEKKPIDLKFNITFGGEKQISFNADWLRMKYSICRSFVSGNVVDIAAALKKNAEKAGRLAKEAEGAEACRGIPAMAEIKKEIASAETLLKTVRESADVDPDSKAASLGKAAEALKKAEFLISTVLRPALRNIKTGKPEMSFAVGIAPAGEKVFRDLPFSGTFGGEAFISLAGNEYESAQFVIFRLKNDADPIKVSCSGLKGENGSVIKAEDITVNPVGYVNIGDTGHHTHAGYWPDVLYPYSDIAYPAKGTVQPVMVTVKAAMDQRPGVYSGTVVFENKSGRQEIRLKANVYPFSLPDSKSLGMNIWFHGMRPAMFYRQFPFSQKLFDQIMGVMGKYHFAAGIRDNMFKSLLRVRRDGADKYKFDFSLLTPYYDISLRHNANMLNLEYIGPEYFRTPHKILIGADGRLENFMPADPDAASDQLFRETVRFFKEKGYWKYAVIQVSDEPWAHEKQEYIRKTVTRMRKLEKDLPPLISAGALRHVTNVDGYLTAWCPQFPQFRPEDYRNLPKNESLYFYQCLYKQDFPMFMIDRPGIEPRIAAMICWKYGAKGFIYWTGEQWLAGPANTPENKKKLANPWIHEEWGFPFRSAPGDGCFIYPTKDGVIPSLRAQYIRDGVEDYEYMAILKKYYGLALKKGRLNAALRRKAEALLKVPDQVVRAANSWTRSEDELEKFRNETAETIIELKKAAE